MRIEAQLTAAPVLAMQPTPALIVFAELLAMAAADLEERVDRELAANPALDRDQAGVCPACGGQAVSCRCAAAARLVERRPAADGRADLLEQLACRRTLPERLLEDLRPSLAAVDRPIAEYVAYSLDDRGRLAEAPGDVAAALGVPAARVQAVLQLLRQAGPPGVAARDGRECLLLQLDRWEEEYPPEPLVRRILEDHLEALGAGRLGAIAGATGAGAAEVLAAREFIRARLRPYPPQETEAGDGVARPHEAPRVLPDVLIVEAPDRSGGFQVQLTEPRRLGLLVDPLYETLAATGSAAPAGVKAHARSHVQRAREFLSRLEQRWRTLRQVAEYLVQRQEAFLRCGPRYLEPLTRAEVAAAVGLHESTVSRAVAGKYATLPSGSVVPMSRFFDGSLAFRELLRGMIAAETRPLSDAELARALAARGHPVARRTVAKYRARLGIPACSGR